MKHLLILLSISLLFIVLQLPSPAQAPSYKDVLDNLAKVDPTASIDLPAAFFQNAESTALGQLQRGIVLYAAAGRARESSNLDRVPVLIDAARTRLLYAKNNLLSTQTEAKARCLYYLGLIAEKQEGNQATASNYYQQAAGLSSDLGANDAFGRMEHAKLP